MKRRDFIKVSGTAAAGMALGGCTADWARRKKAAVERLDFRDRIAREVEPFAPLNIKEITIDIGLRKPFDVLHISDTHILRADKRDEERKAQLAASRTGYMGFGEHYLEEAIHYAREHGMYMMHTGDLCDFISEANLDLTARYMLEADWFVCAGNHEFSHYLGEAREDEAYKARRFDDVQGAFPNDLFFASREIGGVNFVAVDDVYYNFSPRHLELMKAEVAKGLPIILLIHIPLYTPEFCAVELEATGGNCAYLTGVPLEITETFDPGKTYPEGQEWRYRKVQQRADTPTLEFIAWIKEQPLLKGILCGHMHRFFEERFSPTAIQYCVGATFKGDAQVVHFK